MISNLNFDNLSTNTNTVLGLIIDQCVDRRVPHCTFSMTSIRDRTKFSKERIQRSIKQLEDLGYISISRVPMGGTDITWMVNQLPSIPVRLKSIQAAHAFN